MPGDELPPDPDAVEKWKNLPQNEPSKGALPPLTGGLRWVWWLVALLGIALGLGLLTEFLS
jgi:hypothetical protein